MPTRTITKPQTSVDVQQVAADFRAIITELGFEYYERSEILTGMVLCLLAGQHGFLLGPPGSGKSEMCLGLSNRVEGGKFWHILFDRQMGKEEVFGQIDLARYDKEGVWEPDMEDSLADCTVAFGDEIGKAGPALLNSLLTAVNERRVKQGKKWKPIPLMTMFAASNEMLEVELAAMFDRFPWRKKVPYIVEPSNMVAFWQSKVRRPGAKAPTTYTTVELADLKHVVDEYIPSILLPVSMADTLLTLKTRLQAEHGIEISTRRWGQAIRFMQASAFLDGRTSIEDDDVVILADILWIAEEQIPHVQDLVMQSTSEITKLSRDVEKDLDSLSARIDERANDSMEQRADEGADVLIKLADADARLRDLMEKANRDGRSTKRIEAVIAKQKTVKSKCHIVLQNMDEGKAQKRAGLI